MVKILIVEDDKNTRDALRDGLQKSEERKLFAAETAREALKILSEEDIDLVITDLKIPDSDGVKLLRDIKKHDPNIVVIVMTAYGTVDSAVEAMKLGAYDYIQKPFRMGDIRRLVSRALETRLLLMENAKLRQQLGAKYLPKNIIGFSPVFREVLDTVEKVAPSRATVLLLGESGTGKEVIARAIHEMSGRRDKPFVKVNCGALPDSLLESELFGYEKGAFTNAIKQKKGRFELAHGGTIFLDEIADMPTPLQVKLLRVLQDGEFERLGGEETIKVDVRIIAATNKDIEKEIEQGRFREDLYYRLNVIKIKLPPLRQRQDDIIPLAQHFLEKYALLNAKSIKGISPEAMRLLEGHHWRGNVRELENVIERATVLCSGDMIQKEHLPDYITGQEHSKVVSFRIGTTLEEIEEVMIARTLEATGGSKEETARLLGIGVATLYRKLKDNTEANQT
ncbi:MAG: sigma-54 dependent transcriptional regulator [Chloroherpetonaceae bacterium]|nr:sigma-54 dependent transcriptional regulator [Chloroherpetonaceae bacterium]MCS7212108.1 sigma-54 dependent transcriptional regulator [Chloroherpetonaceae bacterium]MDW8020873.1 sigma-54 dependent transcriptional regulator [Chloroherpetonaceae bacterium]MDW8466194.1 sigma-54 dependent transcriptional regulator [Chloroherpetonaceae bacterium]